MIVKRIVTGWRQVVFVAQRRGDRRGTYRGRCSSLESQDVREAGRDRLYLLALFPAGGHIATCSRASGCEGGTIGLSISTV